MTALRSFRDLQVWRRSVDWTESVYLVSRSWPSDERFGLTSQTRRAAVSVAANIAEAAARRTTGEFLQFLGIARGSLAEAETLLTLATRFGYVSQTRSSELLNEVAEIGRLLSGLITSLQKRRLTTNH